MRDLAGVKVIVVGLGSERFRCCRGTHPGRGFGEGDRERRWRRARGQSSQPPGAGGRGRVGWARFRRSRRGPCGCQPRILGRACDRRARVSGLEIWSEIELAYVLARCDFLAVTGTNGKTTTTSLLAAMLAGAWSRWLRATSAFRWPRPWGSSQRVEPSVVEASSFQLATIHLFRPKVAVLLEPR